MEEESIDTPQTVIDSILQGQYDADIDRIYRAVVARREDVKRYEVFQKSMSWKPGDRIQVIDGRPHYLIGSQGTIIKVMSAYCLMKLDQPIGKFGPNCEIRSPMSILKKI